MPSVARLAAAIRAATDQLREAADALAIAQPTLDAATIAFTAAAEGTDHPDLAEPVAILYHTSDRLADAQASIDVAVSATNDYLDTIGALGPASSEVPENTARASHDPDVATPRYVAMAAARLPSPVGKTVGILLDGSGRPMTDTLWSGEDGPGRDSPGIRRDGPKPWANMPVVYHHVEGHAAAVLRQPTAPSEAVLVVSRPPCPGRYGCDRILPDTLPRGTRLWVYVVDGSSRPYLHNGRPYIGNGLGVDR